MGIPKFFRWISERYPLVTRPVAHGLVPEFDNLYIDMNGVIHRCSHPESERPVHLSEEEMIAKMFEFLDVLFHLIKPTKVLFIAIDGVAPRAKMNQQRARRFRAAMDAQSKAKQAQMDGIQADDDQFDSNCITPGTDFMHRLSDHFKFYIQAKISQDPRWMHVQVYFSGQDVPGEGEHKIMEFIRQQRSLANYQVNTRHCIYGADADLMLLSTLTKEPHFCLLRENVLNYYGRSKQIPEDFQLFHVSLLREYLEMDYSSLANDLLVSSITDDDQVTNDNDQEATDNNQQQSTTSSDHVKLELILDRLIDDFVLITFFVGNDFLPNLPFLDIANGALDQVISVHKHVLRVSGQYLTQDGQINTQVLALFIQRLQYIERANLKALNRQDESKEERKKKKQTKYFDENASDDDQSADGADQKTSALDQALAFEDEDEEDDTGDVSIISETTDAVNELLRQDRRLLSDREQAKLLAKCSTIEELIQWKQQYYTTKTAVHFDVGQSPESHDQVKQMCRDYLLGIYWVYFYYHFGCASWEWFYPYHYAPSASDLLQCVDLKPEFDLGSPFSPFEQLLAVLPPYSAKLLPTVYQELMTTEPLKQYYPLEFETDSNGKQNDWEAVVLLPFIDQQLLTSVTHSIAVDRFSPIEIDRNKFGSTWLFEYTTDKSLWTNIQSQLTTLLPLSLSSPVTIKQFNPKSYEKQPFRTLPGVRVGLKAPAGFATTRSLKFEYRMEQANLQLFQGIRSRGWSYIVGFRDTNASIEQWLANFSSKKIVNDPFEQAAAQIAKLALGKQVFVEWPFHQQAKLVGLSTGNKAYKLNSDGSVISEGVNFEKWFYRSAEHLIEIKKRHGIEVAETAIVCHVQPIIGTQYHPIDGSRVRVYGPVAYYPIQLVVRSFPSIDHRLDAHFGDIAQSYPVGTVGVLVCEDGAHSAELHGALAKVIAHDQTSIDKPLLVRIESLYEPSEVVGFDAKSKHSEEYFSSDSLAEQLGISGVLMSALCSSLVIMPDAVDIGLKLRQTKKNVKLHGYTRRTYDGNRANWQYTGRVASLIKEYMNAFPELFERLNELYRPRSELHAKDVFPNSNANKQLHEIIKWLASNEVAKMERTSNDEKLIALDKIRLLDRSGAQLLAQVKCVTTPEAKIVQTDTRHFFRALVDFDVGPEQKHIRLGHRVCYMRVGDYIPFGLTGTVIGTHQACAIVMFDQPIINGSTLGGIVGSLKCRRAIPYSDLAHLAPIN